MEELVERPVERLVRLEGRLIVRPVKIPKRVALKEIDAHAKEIEFSSSTLLTDFRSEGKRSQPRSYSLVFSPLTTLAGDFIRSRRMPKCKTVLLATAKR